MTDLRFLDRDGVRLACVGRDGPGRPIVFVHGWCCDHGYFDPQIEFFAGRGHHTVALDLRGHGRSDTPSGRYTIGLFADDVAWLIERLALAAPVVVGHSMGGIVAYDLAVRYPRLLGGIVMLDAAVAFPAAARALVPAFLEHLRGPDYRAALRRYVEAALFLPTDDPDRRARILDGMASAPQHVMVSAFEGLRDYEAPAGLAVPGLYLTADEPVPRSDVGQLARLAPNLHHGRVVGSGHFCQLEVPEQVDAMIARFLALLEAGRA